MAATAFELFARGDAAKSRPLRVVRVPLRTGRHFALRGGGSMFAGKGTFLWIHVASEGEWKGHEAGGFEFTHESFVEMIDNFEAIANRVPVDIGHTTVYQPDDAPAVGWMHKLATRGVELWALIEWSPLAVPLIDKTTGKYRYSSGVFERGTDRKTGKPIGWELTSIALTNTPFIDGQKPIALSRVTRATSARRSMEPQTNPDEVKVPVPAADTVPSAAATAIAPLVGLTPEQVDAWLVDHAEDIAAMVGGESSEMDATARTAQQTAASRFVSLSAQLGAERTQRVELSKQVVALSTKLAEHDEARSVADVDALMSARKIAPASREMWLKLRRTDPANFVAMSATLTPLVPVTPVSTGGHAGNATIERADGADPSDPMHGLDDTQKAIALSYVDKGFPLARAAEAVRKAAAKTKEISQ